MVKYVLTGVDGGLGHYAANFALEIAPPGTNLTFTTFSLNNIPADTLKSWREKGATVIEANYDEIEGLKAAFVGAEAVNLISTWAFGRRAQQAQNVIDAAKANGVRRICYTSFVDADDPRSVADMPFLPRDHKMTEELIRTSGLEYNIQRDYLYQDNMCVFFAPSWNFNDHKWLFNSHNVPGAYVAKEDCGRVLGALLLGRGEPNKVYTITGPVAVTDKEMFDWYCNLTGYKGEFVDVPDDELRAHWLGRGLPDDVSGDFSNIPMKLCIEDLLCCGQILAEGFMTQPTNHVELLTGRKPLPYQEALVKYKNGLDKFL
ncbi:hypothetical protein N7495_002649 [Penicillium taxi]|uniref:uncharacterized protein n=1 Tax=Penicillium taxi TaxID=168475 RepID=UPI002544E79B|nr:uncharacterized protein N7495_002649 [Penicillium taxi]KAJ5902121.1 hypothetical protein N7495_002649 [Penicillium taxi]